MKKCFLIIIAVILLAAVGVLFIPSIYKKYTKPTWNNNVDRHEWYSKVDPENLGINTLHGVINSTGAGGRADMHGYSLPWFSTKGTYTK